MFDTIGDRMRTLLAHDRSPSVAVAVGRGDEIVFEQASGFADFDERRAASPETAYLLASVTKPIAATCICLLAERGAIDLDGPIEDHLGGSTLPGPEGWPRPTVRQVLQHRSGLGEYYRFSYGDEDRGSPDFAETIERYGVRFAPPGSRSLYSNLGYGLLGRVIASVSGRSPGAFAREALFGPLGMTSGWIGTPYEGPADSAIPYTSGGARYPAYDMDTPTASLAWSSAPDLARFGLAHAGGSPVLSADLRRQMHEPAAAEVMDDGTLREAAYGLGWRIQDAAGIRVISHGGGMSGVSTLLTVVPEERLAVAVLANVTESKLPSTVTRWVLDELLPSVAEALAAADAAEVLPGPVSSDTLARLVGTHAGAIATYVGDVALLVRIEPDGPVTAEVGGQPPIRASLFAEPGWDASISIPRRLPTPDAATGTDSIVCSLSWVDDRLEGQALAKQWGEGNDYGRREGNGLPHLCTLQRLP